MRKFFSLLTGTLFGVLVVAAPIQAQGLSLGAEAGVNLSSLSVDEDEADVDFGSTTGVRVGGTLGYNTGILGFETGASFSQKGATLETLEGAVVDEASLDLEYLEVPLLLTINIPTGPAPIAPQIYGGGNFAFEMSCGFSASGGGVEASTSCSSDDGELAVDTKSLDVGLLVGGGLDLAAGPGAFTVDVRYDLGLSDIADDGDDPASIEVKNRNVQAVAGYALTLP